MRLPFQDYNVTDNRIENLLFINTCPFDSICEMLCSMYLENPIFNEDINECNKIHASEFLKMIINYCADFSLESFYKNRARIFYSIYGSKQEGRIIDCRDNVTKLLVDLMQIFPSFKKSIKCNICQYESLSPYYSMTVSVTEYYMYGVEKLQNFLENRHVDKVLHCEKCNEKSALTRYQLNNYVAVDVEYLHEQKNCAIFNNIIKEKLPFSTDLNRIPTEMVLKNKMFNLSAVICFSGDSENISNANLIHLLYVYTIENQ